MFMQLADFQMGFAEYGQGPPLLFIHGFPLNRKMWQPQIVELSQVARVIAPDLRGHGESSATLGTYGMDLLADDCCTLLDNLGITQPVNLCGLSMGGYIAFAFYRRYPERVKGLILAATRAGPDSPEGKVNREKAVILVQEHGAPAIANSMLPKMLSVKTYIKRPELVEHIREIMENTSVDGIVGALLGMKARPDSTPMLGQIAIPTLILHGIEDQLIPIGEAEALHRAIHGSSLGLLPDAGHLLNLEQPVLFNKHVNEFLDGKY